MSNTNFNLSQRKKSLYKKRKIRRILILTIFSFIILSSINSIITIFFTDNNFIATINLPKADEEEDFFTVCIDPGHGYFDSGAIANDIHEKDVVLDVSLKLGEFLSSHDDIKIIYTRTSDSLPWLETSNDSLKERIAISNVSNSDIIVSIHCNSHPDDFSIKGIETWYKPTSPNSKILSSILLDNLTYLNFTDNRGLKTYTDSNDELAMVELPKATSSLVELGFLSNINDVEFLSSDFGVTACAEALYKGIIEYKELIEN